MLCLSVDTTAKTAAVCVSKFEDGLLLPLGGSFVNGTLTHSETLLPMINDCLEKCSKSVSDVDVFAVSAGPGSFTGVRIGVAAIKGLSFAKKERHFCVGVSSLESLANNLCAPLAENVVLCPVMDARRSQVYNALFVHKNGKTTRLCHDRLITAKELFDELNDKYKGFKIVFVGDGAFVCKGVFDKEEKKEFDFETAFAGMLYQNAFSVAKTAFDYFDEWFCQEDEALCGGKNLAPVYLRASQAERELAEKMETK